MDDTVFHVGERMVQERTGERAIALLNSRNIGSHIPAAALTFIGKQLWCVIGAADESGASFASTLIGEPGFIEVDDDLRTLRIAIDDPRCHLLQTAPLCDLQVDQSVAVLLIELQTRRRLRVIGRVASTSKGALEVAVGQAFPVCPRYIQKREPETLALDAPASSPRPDSGVRLVPDVTEWITAADTMFIASLGPTGDADVSHRGGSPGFMQVQGQVLRIPDYNGNSMFNTMGNLEVESRCGLVLPDFDGTRQLQLTGHARTLFDVKDDVEQTGGTGRWIEFTVEAWRITLLNKPLRWRFVEASRFNP